MLELMLSQSKAGSGPPVSAGSALFAGGHYGGITNVIDKYRYSNDVVSTGTALANARYYLGGTGNASAGLFAGGGGRVIDKYIYTGDVMQGSIAQLAQSQNGPIGLSSTTEARFCGGDGQLQWVNGFFYSNNTIFAGAGMRTARYGGAGAGNKTIGLAACGVGSGGTNINAVDICTFNSDSWAGGTALGQSRSMCAAIGTPTFAIFSRDTGTNTDKYNYSANTITAGNILILPRAYLAGASDDAVGVFGGGYVSQYVTNTDRIVMASDTIRAGTSLSLARGYLAASSSVPGGLA